MAAPMVRAMDSVIFSFHCMKMPVLQQRFMPGHDTVR